MEIKVSGILEGIVKDIPIISTDGQTISSVKKAVSVLLILWINE